MKTRTMWLKLYKRINWDRFSAKGIGILLAIAILLPMFTWLASVDSFKVEAATGLNETNCHISDSGVITWYNGSYTAIDVPDQINGVTVTGIGNGVFMNKGITSVTFSTTALVSIGDQAFQNNALTHVTIPDTVTSIGAQAFFENNIANLTLPAGLNLLGEYAFRSNNLTSVTLPASLDELSEGVFMQNPNLSSANLDALLVINDSAFSGCYFDTVTLPSGLTGYGDNVFANNHRYVLVSGNSLAKTYSVAGQFGEIAGDIRTLTVKYQDMHGNQLLSDKTYTSNRNIQAAFSTDLVVDGNTVTIALPSITGYNSVNGASKSIVITGDMTYVAKYIVDGDKPVIQGLDPITVAVGEAVDLRAGVTAMDYRGNDLTTLIDITPSAIDTSAPRGYSVKYTVRDSDGRITVEYRDVLIGNDPMKMEIGGGWLYEDFLYSADGTSLQGLSASGVVKFNAGFTIVILPGKCPKAANGSTNVSITAIAAGTSTAPRFPQNFTYISFDRMTSLTVIGDDAFGKEYYPSTGTQCTELDLSKCTLLQSIGNGAFYNARLITLDLSGCVNLQTIGDNAFYSSQLTTLDLSENVNLQAIRMSAFYSSLLTMLDLSGCANLQTINNNAFRNSVLTTLDLSGCANLQTIADMAFYGSVLTTLDLRQNVKLETIGDYAFGDSLLTTLDLSKNVNLVYLSGFNKANLTTLDLSKNVKLETIGDYAFRDSKLTTLDLSKNINLQTIEPYAFYSSLLTTLDLSGCVNLQTIGNYAFYSSLLTELDVNKNVKLKTIGNNAFDASKLTTLDLSGCVELRTVGSFAFYSSVLTTLDVSGCVNLQTIGGMAFYDARLTTLDLTKNIQLKEIGSYAFNDSMLTTLDLSKNVNLETIGGSAFTYSTLTTLDLRQNTKLTSLGSSAFSHIKNNASVYLPDSLANLPSNPFGYDPEKAIWVYTNVATLTDQTFINTSLNKKTHIFINKTGYWVDLHDEQGNKLSAGCPIVAFPMGDVGNTITVTPPTIYGYTAPGAQTLTLDGSNRQTVTFVCARGNTWVKHDYIEISMSNPVNYRYRVQYANNAEAQIAVSFDASTDFGKMPAGSEIVIPFYGESINMSTLRMGTTSALVDSWYVQGRELHLVLNEIKGGDKLVSFPILFQFYGDGSMPYDCEAIFDAYIVHGETKKIVASSNPAQPARAIGYFTKGSMTAYVNRSNSTNQTINLDDDTDVYLGWGIFYSAGNSPYRIFDTMEITYDIPTYVNSAGERVHAQFIPENNPGWQVVATDGGGNPTKVRLASEYYISAFTGSEFALRLRFPDAMGNQQVSTSINAILTPQDASATELAMVVGDRTRRDSGQAPLTTNLFYLSATNNFYIPDTKAPPAGEIIRVDKDANPMAINPATGKHYGDGHGEFYDNDDNTGRIYGWTVTLLIGPDYTATNAVLHDHGLDPRMYYYGLTGLDSLLNEIEIVATDAAGNELCREMPAGNSFVFDADIQHEIAKVDIFFLGEFTEDQTVILQTKLYDEDMTAAKAGTSGGVDFYNYASGEFDAKHRETGASVHAAYDDPNWSYSYWKILHNPETLRATKSNNPTGILFRGDYLTYTVGVAGVKMSGSAWDGFALLDILPDCVELVDVRMSDAFASIPGAKVEIIHNYNGSGLTGVLYTVEAPNKFTCPVTGPDGEYYFRVGYIDVKIGNLFNAANFTNDVFAKVNASTGVTLQNTVTAANSYNLNGTADASRAYVQNGYITIQELSLRKYIRNITGEDTAWSSTGIITEPGAAFEYKLTLGNFTSYSLPDGIVYDIFPFVGDTYIEKIILGSEFNIPRNSQFRNTFVSAVAPTGWTILYTDDPNAENTREFYASADWKTAAQISDFSKVTGLKFVADSGTMIPAMSSLDFNISMKAPEDVSLVGKRAYNTAAHKENESNNPGARELECNAVYNEIRQRGDVSLRKVDENGNPLAGAVFQIIDSRGRIIQTKPSGADGRILFDDLVIGNYTIKEVSPPEGFMPYTGTITVSESDMVAGGVYHIGDVENRELPPPPKVGSVTLIKNSEAGTILRGVQFRVTGVDAGINDHISQTKATNTRGQVVFNDLPLGHYKIEELQTNGLGYLEADYQDTFEITADGQVINLGVVLNDTAAVTLVKIGIFHTEYQALPNSELDATMGGKLAGIRFELYDDNDELVSSGLTNASGQLAFSDLELGKTYTLKEILTPEQASLYGPRGSGADHNEYTFSVGLDGKLTFDGNPYDKQNLIIGNNILDLEYKALLRKVDQNGDPLENVEFEIRAEGVTAPQSLYTDINGELLLTKSQLETLFGADATGTFYITEVAAPLGYAKSFGPDSVWEINWNNPNGYDEITFVNQKLELNINKYSRVTSTVYETLQHLNLTELLGKYDETTAMGDVSLFDILAVVNAAVDAGLELCVNDSHQWELRIPLAGAVFTVAQVSDPSNTFTATTDSGGKLPIPTGFVIDENETYEVRETTAPSGYRLNETVFSFKVADLKLTGGSGNVTYSEGNINISVDNDPLTGSIVVTKLDQYKGTVLSGVGFTLYNTLGGKVAEVYTDSNGVAVFSGLPFGDYTLKETDPMPGYEPDLTGYSFTLSAGEGQQYQYITLRNEPIVKYSRLTITKVNGNGDPLAGIEFYLMYSNDGGNTWDDYLDTHEKPYYFTNSQGKLVFDNLPAGMYKIVEITEDPRYGDPIYSPSDTFTVPDNQRLDIQITVTNPDMSDVVTLDLEGTKVLRAIDGTVIPVVEGEFVFTLTPSAGNPDGCIWDGRNPVGVSAGGAIDLGRLTFSQEGVYVFTIREIAPSVIPAGWVYDADEVTVTVEVGRGNRQLKIMSTSYSKGGEDVNGINFVNECGLVLGSDSTLIITKTDNNGTLLSGIAFCLMVSNDGGATWSDYGTTRTAPLATNELGKLIFRNLSAGMYKIVEITDDPKYGDPVYSPSDIFTILEGESRIVEVTVVNPYTTPRTGDPFRLGYWMMVSGLATVGMMVSAVRCRRKKKSRTVNI